MVLLLRVGIDRGTGGALSPIFADGSLEYVPIPEAEPTRCRRSFASLPARHGGTLAAFVPSRIAGLPAHLDPDFAALTYGDAALHKRRQLSRLEPGSMPKRRRPNIAPRCSGSCEAHPPLC